VRHLLFMQHCVFEPQHKHLNRKASVHTLALYL
jgi:hypothetical protein